MDIVTAPDRASPPVEVFDFSFLNAAGDGFQIDTGVTSGADATLWDEILVEGRVDACDANGAGADASAAAICHTEKDQKN